MPEGTIDNLVITDELPTGLEYVDSYIVRSASDIPGTAGYTAANVATLSALTTSSFDPTGAAFTGGATQEVLAGDGTTTVFTAASDATGVTVVVDGVVVTPASIVGDQITFTTAPDLGAEIVLITAPVLSTSDETLAGDGTTTVFTATASDLSDVAVTVDGVAQTLNTDFTVDGSEITFTAAPAAGAEIVVSVPSPAPGATGDLTFTFDPSQDIANLSSDTANTFMLVIQARVQDVASNVGVDTDPDTFTTLTNNATLDFDPGDGEDQDPIDSGTTVQVDVVEPVLQIEKSVEQTEVDAGDTLNYTLDISHDETSTQDAFDLVIRDLFEDGEPLAFSGISTVKVFDSSDTDITSSATIAASGDGFTVSLDGLELGETISITYEATLTSDAGINDNSIVNTADLVWDSHPDEPGDEFERDYDPVEDTATVTTGAEISFEKVIVATSAAHTGADQHTDASDATGDNDTTADLEDDHVDLVVGEDVTYELRLTLEEGTWEGVVITDTLPSSNAGTLEFVSAQISSNTAGMTIGGVLVENVPMFQLLERTDNVLTFDFGDILNPGNVDDNDADDTDTLILQVRARVSNVDANQDGVTATNSATVTTEEGTTPITDIAVIDIVEPELSLEKVVAQPNGDAGDTFDYTLTIEHTDDSTADAFDLVIADPISDSRLDYVANSVTVTDGDGNDITSTLTITPGTDGFSFSVDSLGLDESLTVKFQARLNNTVGPNEVIPNTATLTWDTLPLDNDPNERDGSDSDEAHIDTGAVADLEKVIVGTSHEHTESDAVNAAGDATGDNDVTPAGDDFVDVTIGERVFYELRVTLEEGTWDNVVIRDTLPSANAGSLEFVSAQISSNPSGMRVGATLLENLDISSLISEAGNVVTFSLGDIVNPGDVDETDTNDTDTFVIRVVARASDVAANVSGVSATNSATLTTDAGTNITDIAVVDIVEPLLELEKFVTNKDTDSLITDAFDLNDDGDPTTFDAGSVDPTADSTVTTLGETITYQLDVTHHADSTADAFDLRIFDAVDNIGTDGFGTISNVRVLIDGVEVTSGFVDQSTATEIDIRFASFDLETQEKISILFDVALTDDAGLLLERGGPDGVDILNEAELSWQSLPEGVAPDQRTNTETDTAEVRVVATDLTVSKNDGVQSREAGDLYEYRLDWEVKENHSGGDFSEATVGAKNVVVTDILPAELTFVSSSIEPDSIQILATGETRLVWNLGDLDSGESGRITVNVQVNETSGPFPSDIINTVTINNDLPEPNTDDNRDRDRDELIEVVPVELEPDVFITKNDGQQERSVGERYDYILNFGNQQVHDDGETLTGRADVVTITDILPEALQLEAMQVQVNGEFIDVIPEITTLEDGSTRVHFSVGGLDPGDVGQVVMTVSIREDLPPGEYEIENRVGINWRNTEIDLTDNRDNDIDVLTVQGENPLFGGSSILQGFRFVEPGIPDDGEGEKDGPILTLMPIYSGLADPGTVLNIKILGEFGEVLTNGTSTVVADAGGNWLAKFPGLVLHDEPHRIIVEQSKPAWNLGGEQHGYNLRTYFAPAISPTHVQSEQTGVEEVMTRRLVPIKDMMEQNRHGDMGSNRDWRLGQFEFAPVSGIGGVLE